jgi:hypothetical protein
VADFIDHLNQAKHNLECAKSFLKIRNAHDWAITAAFYSAIHFVEAGFTAINSIEHTEVATPRHMSHHEFRQRTVLQHFGNDCYRNYRKIKEASHNVRYLALHRSQTGISLDYYPPIEASRFVNENVNKVRRDVQNKCGLDLS